jgi:hypothetical protein
MDRGAYPQVGVVARDGFEPPTPRFSAACSAN